MKFLNSKFFLWALDSSRISVASKWLTLFTATLVFMFLDEILVITESPPILFAALAFENTVLAGAFLPLGLISILSAKHLLTQGLWFWIIFGYLGALLGNVASFSLGKFIGTKIQGSKPEPHSVPLTFWHPNLASLTAFSEGLRDRKCKNYLREAVPWSVFWYSVVMFIIFLLPQETRSSGTFTLVAFVVLFLWILLPTLRETYKELKNRA